MDRGGGKKRGRRGEERSKGKMEREERYRCMNVNVSILCYYRLELLNILK